MTKPFYDPMRSYEENFYEGPFGAFDDGEVYEEKGEPKYDFFGHKVYTPFGIPAGPLLNEKYTTAAFEKGFDINVHKTVRTRPLKCHKWPNVLGVELKNDLTIKKSEGQLVATTRYTEPLSITNSFGVPSMNPDWWQEDMVKAIEAAGEGQVLVGSFQGTSTGSVGELIEDYVLAAKLVKETGAKVLEANLSCPNEGKKELLCFDSQLVLRIAAAIKDEIGNVPLILKLAYFESQEKLSDWVDSVGRVVDGVAAINTIPAKVVNEQDKQALPGKGRAISGICGAGIKWAGVEMVERLVKLRQDMGIDLMIIGVGGVTHANDYEEYIRVGADAVMSATGAMWNPYLAQEIKEEEV